MRIAIPLLALSLVAAPPLPPAYAGDGGLGVEDAIRLAIERDPWLAGSRHRETALASEAVAAAQLPDPKVSLTAANLPTDSFDFGQEAMTQLSVGVSQMFPRGDTLTLAKRQKEQIAAREPLLRADREAAVTATVSRLWLDVFRERESIRLIENDRVLFEQLADAVEAKYSVAMGRTRIQDVVRAQLELTRLEDRLTALRQREETARQRLSEWIGAAAGNDVGGTLPVIEPDAPALVTASATPARQTLYERVRRHPAVLAVDRHIDAAHTEVDLARQKYKPQWGVMAKYGYRDEAPMGQERADLLSVGVTFDLPVFTGRRQDRTLAAATSRADAATSERALLVRKLVAQLEEARDRLARLDERKALYEKELLPRMREQAEASLTAYYNDDGDFAEAVRAHIDELDAGIEALVIAVDRLKTVARINYLLARAPDRGIER